MLTTWLLEISMYLAIQIGVCIGVLPCKHIHDIYLKSKVVRAMTMREGHAHTLQKLRAFLAIHMEAIHRVWAAIHGMRFRTFIQALGDLGRLSMKQLNLRCKLTTCF
jgi:hypothetical protein